MGARVLIFPFALLCRVSPLWAPLYLVLDELGRKGYPDSLVIEETQSIGKKIIIGPQRVRQSSCRFSLLTD